MTPQPIKEECNSIVWAHVGNNEWSKIKKEHFDNFKKGKHITWQQWLILEAIEQAIRTGKNKISIVSGHGIGKSAVLSWLVIWFLFCHYDAQVGATAPTSEQMHDVLWKEVALWMGKMPDQLQDLFEWTTGYIRVKERQETWFARARTARKEAPEAIAGLHADNVMIVADEASGIPDEIFRSAEGSMTGPNVLVILIGNGTRNSGYFYDTHHDDRVNWQEFSFSSEDSPIVVEGYIERMEAKWGRDSEEFRIRVAGGFPASEQMDDRGWIPLLTDNMINQVSEGDVTFAGRKVMTVDPSGEGDNMTVWMIRDNFFARVVATEISGNAKAIARKTLDLIKEFQIDFNDVYIDNFGVGANVKAEMLLIDNEADVQAINWGDDADDDDVFLNKRAECCFRAKEWFLRGGAIVGDELRRDILAYQYSKNELSGKRKILDKPRLIKRLGRSPDRGDAFFMTFYDDIDLKRMTPGVVNRVTQNDVHSAI